MGCLLLLSYYCFSRCIIHFNYIVSINLFISHFVAYASNTSENKPENIESVAAGPKSVVNRTEYGKCSRRANKNKIHAYTFLNEPQHRKRGCRSVCTGQKGKRIKLCAKEFNNSWMNSKFLIQVHVQLIMFMGKMAQRLRTVDMNKSKAIVPATIQQEHSRCVCTLYTGSGWMWKSYAYTYMHNI